MAHKRLDDEEMRAYLLSYAPIESFYITGVINFFDSSGKVWCLMEADDDVASDAVEFLKKNGAPCFEDIETAVEFEKEWRQLQSR
jgi:hypothetical protein